MATVVPGIEIGGIALSMIMRILPVHVDKKVARGCEKLQGTTEGARWRTAKTTGRRDVQKSKDRSLVRLELVVLEGQSHQCISKQDG